MSTIASTLRTWAKVQVVADRRATLALWVAAFVLATAFGAQVAVPVPLTSVPMTLQVLFVILAGAVLGPWLGAAAMATYLTIGVAGAPVFSGGGAGLPWLLGPTGGYLVAMPAAAFLTGWVAGRNGSRVRLLAGLAVGVLTIYAGGVSQLYLLTRQAPGALLAVGVVPFLGVDATKIVVAFVLARTMRTTSLGR
jgi:biotin transport system substrate-specific component